MTSRKVIGKRTAFSCDSQETAILDHNGSLPLK
jgi:hypothetical protein